MKIKYTVITLISIAIISFVVIYLNLVSHEKTQKIYLEQTEKAILNLKKDFLSDTVNNLAIEINRLRDNKYNNYKRNTEARLRRLQDELDLTEEEFVNFFIERFTDDSNAKMWTAFMWDSSTGEVLFDSSKLYMETIDDTVENLKGMLSSYEVVRKGSIAGIFGVSKAYIDDLVKEEIGNLIRNRNYTNDSYIWVNEVINYEGGKDYAIRRIHPNLRETEGTYLSTDMEDIQGNQPYLEELEGIKKNGEIFFTYYFKELNSSKISEKITYAKLYQDYDWIIAMGVHLDDIDAYTKEVNSEISSLSGAYIIRLLRSIYIVLLIGFIVLYMIHKKYVSNSTRSLEKEVNLDQLTKASSRRYGEISLNTYFKKFKLIKEKPAIMMFDIDDFKHINDNYGHSVGDMVLIEIVKCMDYMIRSSDQVIRWGGDEFVAIFPGLREEHIKHFGEKLLEGIASIRVPVENESIGITISLGISYFRDTDKDYNDVLKRADDALYQSKEQGKNRMNIIL